MSWLSGMFKADKTLNIYGTPGNQYGNTMVGGKDVHQVNAMLDKAFQSGVAGVGDATVKIGSHKGRDVFEQKAVDRIRISLDDGGNAYVKMIIRGGDPGMGLAALVGGFKDAGETDAQAADREEDEEAKSKKGALVSKHEIPRQPVTGDVRVWGGKDRPDGVKSGDIIALSTKADIFVVRNVHDQVEAGDDATGAAWVPLSAIHDANAFGIKTHAKILQKAAQLAGVADQLPKGFEISLKERESDIVMANDYLKHKAAMMFTPADTKSAAVGLDAHMS